MEKQVFEVWTYDVWGNARDGFDVNDRCKVGTVTIHVKPVSFNVGTEHEFTVHYPTDRQCAMATGWQGCHWDGDENTIYAELNSNGRPVGELVRVDHE